MQRFELPTDRAEYLQLAFPASGAGLVALWRSRNTPLTVAAWDQPGAPPVWQLTDLLLHLSPDGEWVSVFDKPAGKVRIIPVGAERPVAVMARDKGAENVWTAVAPGGTAVAWKDGKNDAFTHVYGIPGGETVARVKTGFGYDLRFSPGGRWLTERGDGVFRVLDRTDGYRVLARIPAPSHVLPEVTDGPTAVVATEDGSAVAVRDLSAKSVVATLPVVGAVSALAISPDGRRVLTGTGHGETILWDAAGTQLRRYAWGVKTPIAAAFARDGLRAAVGGRGGQIVVWDLDD